MSFFLDFWFIFCLSPLSKGSNDYYPHSMSEALLVWWFTHVCLPSKMFQIHIQLVIQTPLWD